MAFTVPTFNLTVRVWRNANWAGTIPPVNPADAEIPANLRMLKTAFIVGRGALGFVWMALCVPRGTDLRGGIGWGLPANQPDLVEVPKGSGRYYTVAGVDDVARGFSNEYRLASIQQAKAPVPLP